MRSVKHSFAQNASVSVPRSSFQRDHRTKTTFDAGWLVPVYVEEVLPGDTIKLNMSTFCRLATPLHPIMDDMHLESFFFFVPNRLTWKNWQRFCGEQDSPGDSTDFLIPTAFSGGGSGIAPNSLGDYMGLPTTVPDYEFNILPLRCYNLIWNQFFRDQNLQDPVATTKNDGPDSIISYNLKRRGKRHDYFTSCLPWPQKGPSVELPLGTTAPVVGTGDLQPIFSNAAGIVTGKLKIDTDATNILLDGAWTSQDIMHWKDTKLEADISAATSITVNQLRQSVAIQQLYEKDARGGTRYTEILKAHFGVVSDDARLQRPEYLSGGTQRVNFTPVPQTSETETTPQGNLSAYGTSIGNNHGFLKSFTEHGYVIGLVSVRADLTYQQGLDRLWNRRERWDFYWPNLSGIGEQAVLNKEIFINNDANDELVFGYQERFAEYRFKRSTITGEFRSAFPQSLDTWHLSQDFATLPLLQDEFIEDDPPVDRIIAVPTEPHFLFEAYFSQNHVRPIPIYGTPGLSRL